MKYFIFLIFIISKSSIVNAQFILDKFGTYIESGTNNNEIVITNTGNSEILVFSKEDTDATKKISGQSLFYIHPSVIKLEPKESRTVNIILKNKKITTEVLGRLVFKEMVSTKNVSRKTVVNTSYNISVVGRPYDLVKEFKPWEYLVVRVANDKLILTNPSKYIIKMMSGISLYNGNNKLSTLKISNNYILPEQTISIPINHKLVTSIKIQPVSISSNILPPVIIKI